MTAPLIFFSTFVIVFALGFQSQNVNQGRYFAAAITSFFIGGANLAILRIMPNPNLAETAAYLIAGPIAIVASMAAHKKFMKGK